ncbi:hypothetical protein [Glycomyces xiaoerkulensis]|uniref:hypothetical protein n=1 Tax=Glycomyces xiaoerkulensis TaxID=2038139 RepID=UPI0018E456AF|nr:hypothetical protein [Glycomyces xiaoerkulensis]
MTEPSDRDRPHGPALPYGERYAWGYLTTAVAVPAVYAVIMLGRLGDAPADQIDFQRPLLIAIAASIVANMFLAPGPRKGRDRRDERDRGIDRRGESAGFLTLAVAVLGAFALTMFEAPYFWIANAIYFAFVLSAIVQSVVKVAAYRRGF